MSAFGDKLDLEVVVTNKTDKTVSIIDKRSDAGSYLKSGYAFRYSLFKDTEAHDTFYHAPLMKDRSSNEVSEFAPHQKETTSVEITYLEKIEHYYFASKQHDGPTLSFTQYSIPVKGSGKFKLWVEYDQTSTKENYTQQRKGIQLWKGKVMSNTVIVEVK